MKLTPKTVSDVLEAILGWRVEMNPHGFELQTSNTDCLAVARARLKRGSGIAGRGDVRMLVHLPNGAPIVTGIATKAKLERAVLEFMAGPRPAPLSDYTAPRAKRMINPRTNGARFVWYRRLKPRSKPRVALVPFGAAQR